MAKNLSIELDKTISDIVSKNFKLGTSSEKIITNIINGLINKMIFGDESDRKKIITILVPDILSSSDALKLYNNIIKYKEKEKENLEELMNGQFNKIDSKIKKDKKNKLIIDVKENKEEIKLKTHQPIAIDNEL